MDHDIELSYDNKNGKEIPIKIYFDINDDTGKAIVTQMFRYHDTHKEELLSETSIKRILNANPDIQSFLDETASELLDEGNKCIRYYRQPGEHDDL